jgi:hypothetical protein
MSLLVVLASVMFWLAMLSRSAVSVATCSQQGFLSVHPSTGFAAHMHLSAAAQISHI